MAERSTLDRTAMLEEMIEHDPELRDVLNRRRFFKELANWTSFRWLTRSRSTSRKDRSSRQW
jgi:hypothetical protein